MSIKVFKTIRIILLVVSCITLIAGIVLSKQADEEDRRDLSKIDIQVTEKRAYYSQPESVYSSGKYHVELTFQIQNTGRSTWTSLSVTTVVYDKNGRNLGTINSTFDAGYGINQTSVSKLVSPGETVRWCTELVEAYPNDFMMELYEKDISAFRFESSITYGRYLKD